MASMQEHYLHYLWQFQYFDKRDLATSQGDRLIILHPGIRNEDAGPDFLNSRIIINDITWHGHIELHVKASDWKLHKHQKDPAYDNVVLHVVWENDQPIERKDHTLLPTLSLKDKVDPQLWERYQQLIQSTTKIPCASQIHRVDAITKMSMLDKALFKRLTHKNGLANQLLANNQGDWQATAYQLLSYNFGFKANSPPFLELSVDLPWEIIARHTDNTMELEALLLGQAGLLEKDVQTPDLYLNQLIREYEYLKHKYQLPIGRLNRANWKFFRLRPANFPTIRIAQFAQLLHQYPQLFNWLVHTPVQALNKQLAIQQSTYWQQHYQFGKLSKRKIPGLGRSSIENIFINTVVPLLVAYGKAQDEPSYIDRAIGILEGLPAEDNQITRYWQDLGIAIKTAFDSQASIRCLVP
jgi:hypothetical protein